MSKGKAKIDKIPKSSAYIYLFFSNSPLDLNATLSEFKANSWSEAILAQKRAFEERGRFGYTGTIPPALQGFIQEAGDYFDLAEGKQSLGSTITKGYNKAGGNTIQTAGFDVGSTRATSMAQYGVILARSKQLETELLSELPQTLSKMEEQLDNIRNIILKTNPAAGEFLNSLDFASKTGLSNVSNAQIQSLYRGYSKVLGTDKASDFLKTAREGWYTAPKGIETLAKDEQEVVAQYIKLKQLITAIGKLGKTKGGRSINAQIERQGLLGTLLGTWGGTYNVVAGAVGELAACRGFLDANKEFFEELQARIKADSMKVLHTGSLTQNATLEVTEKIVGDPGLASSMAAALKSDTAEPGATVKDDVALIFKKDGVVFSYGFSVKQVKVREIKDKNGIYKRVPNKVTIQSLSSLYRMVDAAFKKTGFNTQGFSSPQYFFYNAAASLATESEVKRGNAETGLTKDEGGGVPVVGVYEDWKVLMYYCAALNFYDYIAGDGSFLNNSQFLVINGKAVTVSEISEEILSNPMENLEVSWGTSRTTFTRANETLPRATKSSTEIAQERSRVLESTLRGQGYFAHPIKIKVILSRLNAIRKLNL